MKNYKLVNSKEVQEKAFRLGYIWNKKLDAEATKIQNMNQSLLLLDSEIMVILDQVDLEEYLNSDYDEITIKDFLALPEPIKEGDWVKVVTNTGFKLFKVANTEHNNGIVRDSDGNGYVQNLWIKLTPEQIEVLGLGND